MCCPMTSAMTIWRNTQRRVDICMRVTDSFGCTSHANITLQFNCIQIFFKSRGKVFDQNVKVSPLSISKVLFGCSVWSLKINHTPSVSCWLEFASSTCATREKSQMFPRNPQSNVVLTLQNITRNIYLNHRYLEWMSEDITNFKLTWFHLFPSLWKLLTCEVISRRAQLPRSFKQNEYPVTCC